MYCLVQFYMQLKDDLAEHKPLLKLTAVKLVIFLSFWQTVRNPLLHFPSTDLPPSQVLITSLVALRFVKPNSRIARPDIKIGIPSLLICIEMAIFSVFHLWAFPWRVYDIRNAASESVLRLALEPTAAYSGGPLGIKALLDAFNPWDLIKAVGRGFRWFAVGRRMREQDVSYKNSSGTVGLEPMREAAAIPLPSQSNCPLDQKGDHTQLYIGASSTYNHPPLVDEEGEVVAEENNLLPNAPCIPQPLSPSSPNKCHTLQNNNQALADASAVSLHSGSTNHPQDPCSRPNTPPPTQPESPTVDPDSREDNASRVSTDASASPSLHDHSPT
jgi:hypothetical protein